jgi:hypothetical protein
LEFQNALHLDVEKLPAPFEVFRHRDERVKVSISTLIDAGSFQSFEINIGGGRKHELSLARSQAPDPKPEETGR